MTGYTLLDSDEKIIEAVTEWNGCTLAVDFEGEFNLHVYGEHLSLVQIYDNRDYYIIDARSPRISPLGLEAFFSSQSEKLWFDIQGDASLVYKKYKLKINNVFDIRVPAMLLGYKGNLLSLEEAFLGVKSEINKKKNQQANWLTRPIDEELIEYALNDVKYLFALKDAIVAEIKKNHLECEMERGEKRVKAVKEPKPGWRNIGNWRKMRKEEKERLKTLFIVRDNIARRFNVPSSRVMDKHTLLSLALNPPKDKKELSKRIQNEPERFRHLVEEGMWKALSSIEL